MSSPRSETIARTGRGTSPGTKGGAAAEWQDVERLLREGRATCWLSVRGRDGGVHTRPVFAAWHGEALILVTKEGAAKTRHLRSDGDVSLAVDLGAIHLVVEGAAARLTDPAGLERARAAMEDVYSWPTEVVGDELDASYAAPTSGGPPFQAWELVPRRAFAFPTRDQVEPTRFVFD